MHHFCLCLITYDLILLGSDTACLVGGIPHRLASRELHDANACVSQGIAFISRCGSLMRLRINFVPDL